MMKNFSLTLALGLLITSASVPTKSALGAPVTLDRLEASVNSSLILLSDVRDFRETLQLRSQLDPLFAGTELAEKGKNASNQDIVQFLIDERLILSEFPVADAEVEQQINSIQANNNIDRAGLRQMIKDQGFSFDDYFELIRSSVAKRNLIERDIRTKVHISDDDIRNHFHNYIAPRSSLSYHIKMISISPSSYKTKAAANEAAQRALEAIKSGESFEEVARRFSDGPGADTGGDLGVLSADEMNSAIRERVKEMKVGDTSGILGSRDTGLFIIKLAGVRSANEDRMEKMKEEIRNQLTSTEYQRQIVLWLERQRQAAYIHLAGARSVTQKNAN